ncbi:Ilvbl [Columba livia]|nr:Ilvbl [Columba livia]
MWWRRKSGPPEPPGDFGGRWVTWYLRNYIRNLFAGAWEPQDLSPLPIHVPQATQEEVQRCAELLSRARKPLVLLGSQAMLPPTTPAQLCSALESLGIPCYLGGASRGLLPPDSPILLRQNRRDALRDADLVLLAGPFGTLGVGGGFALGAKLCRPDAEVWVLYGDGSLGYSLMEFDTFVRHKTPVIALVGNDACWSQIAREQVALLGSNVACGLAYLGNGTFGTSWHLLAPGLGTHVVWELWGG